MQNIVATIRSETRAWQSKVAIIEGENAWSYARVLDAAEAVAASLRTAGLKPTQRAAIVGDDSVDMIVVHLAVLSLSAVVVPVASSMTRPELNAILQAMQVDVVLWQESLLGFEPSIPLAPGAFLKCAYRLTRLTPTKAMPSAYAALNPAFIRFSSGTTGLSKGVLLSHEAVVARTNAANQGLGIGPDDTILWVLSMSFHFVVSILLFLRKAATIILCHDAFPLSMHDALQRHRGTFIYASPFHYSAMTASSAFRSDDLASVRLALSTAIRLPLSVAEAFTEKFGFPPAQAYGIIEVGLPFINRSGSLDKAESVGTILPGYELAIRHPDATGAGAIALKGPGMFDAYVSPWQTHDACLDDGWFKTGDIGRVDADGCLYILARESAVINFAGMKVFPAEVEDVLNAHPAIAESLVYGQQHPDYGHLPQARIVPMPGAKPDIDDIRRYCFQHLAPYKAPKVFEFVDHLEKTASNKIKRTGLT